MWRAHLNIGGGFTLVCSGYCVETFSTFFEFFQVFFPSYDCTQLRFARQKQPMALPAGVAKHAFQNGRRRQQQQQQ